MQEHIEARMGALVSLAHNLMFHHWIPRHLLLLYEPCQRVQGLFASPELYHLYRATGTLNLTPLHCASLLRKVP
jgi:hypothetical protein